MRDGGEQGGVCELGWKCVTATDGLLCTLDRETPPQAGGLRGQGLRPRRRPPSTRVPRIRCAQSPDVSKVSSRERVSTPCRAPPRALCFPHATPGPARPAPRPARLSATALARPDLHFLQLRRITRTPCGSSIGAQGSVWCAGPTGALVHIFAVDGLMTGEMTDPGAAMHCGERSKSGHQGQNCSYS